MLLVFFMFFFVFVVIYGIIGELEVDWRLIYFSSTKLSSFLINLIQWRITTSGVFKTWKCWTRWTYQPWKMFALHILVEIHISHRHTIQRRWNTSETYGQLSQMSLFCRLHSVSSLESLSRGTKMSNNKKKTLQLLKKKIDVHANMIW